MESIQQPISQRKRNWIIAAAIALVQIRTALRTKTRAIIFAKGLIGCIDDDRRLYQRQNVDDVIVGKHVKLIFAKIVLVIVELLLIISVDEEVPFDVTREVIRRIFEASRAGACSSPLGFSTNKKRRARVCDVNPPANRIAERVIVRTSGQQGDFNLAIIVRALRKCEEL